MVERVLLIINRSSATGYTDVTIGRVRSTLEHTLGEETELEVEVVEDHPQARAQTKAFLTASDAPALVIVSGGSGTLRAVIEGVCEGSEPGNLPGRERVRIAALRMGSGNPVAKQFGVPLDPDAALQGIVANLHQDRTAPCCIIRCEVVKKDSRQETFYGATMGGFGQFGRSPGDLARWHHRLPILRKLTASLIGIERLTNVEYGLSLLTRFAWCAVQPNVAEMVEVRTAERTESMRLLAGVIMNFPVEGLPFEVGVNVEDTVLSLNFIPYPGRWAAFSLLLSPSRLARKALQIRISDSERVEVCLLNRDAAEFFLDEDPMVFHGKVLVQVAGTLAFVPGPCYQWPQRKGECS